MRGQEIVGWCLMRSFNMRSATKRTHASELLSLAIETCQHGQVMELGDLIRVRRNHIGISQRALAIKMGVHASAVAHWENNATRPTYDRLPALRSILGIADDIAPAGTQPLHAKVVQCRAEIALLTLWRGLSDGQRDLFVRLLSQGAQPGREL